MTSTYAINQHGIEMAAAKLTAVGVIVATTGERKIHLFATFPGSADPKAVAVHANLAAKPGGGTGKMALDWWVEDDSPADLIALVDLSTERVWLLTLDEIRRLAQQHPHNSHHIFMVVESTAKSKHSRILDKHFSDFLVSPGNSDLRAASSHDPTLAALDESVAAVEGEARQRLVRHRHRERALRSAKIAEALKKGAGRLVCEAPGCGFDFELRYGPIGRGYAQVHHLKPLADAAAPVETKLTDLAVVCANCHAMIHKGGSNRPLEGLVAGT